MKKLFIYLFLSIFLLFNVYSTITPYNNYCYNSYINNSDLENYMSQKNLTILFSNILNIKM